MTNALDTRRISKLLSYVLRHRPDEFGVVLDESGWVEVEVLLAALGRHGKSISRETLLHVVATNDKKRFVFSDDQTLIRASQGHSISVDLGYEAAEPPEVLYHGTVAAFLESIRSEGLKKGSRHDVHLSETKETAQKVGSRRGKPIILEVRALEMAAAGHAFFVTPNRVWLTNHVPSQFIDFGS